MRTEVILLSRNVVIRGSDEDQWGCSILTASQIVGLLPVSGTTVMDHVEITNCS